MVNTGDCESPAVRLAGSSPVVHPMKNPNHVALRKGFKMEWWCLRCKTTVDYDAFRCGCTESPSPWEPVPLVWWKKVWNKFMGV